MRQVHRPALSGREQAYLNRKALAVTEKSSIDRIWKSARQTTTMQRIIETLQSMMGPRQRCMYCVDSHGSDIEHFWPKASYSNRAFLWPNMLLCCTECGRLKGNRFPLSDDGLPLLVDPSIENPWDYLDFDPDTGNIISRYIADRDIPSEKGEHTVQILQLDRREGMAEGYRRTYRRIVTRVGNALAEDVIDPQQLAEDLLLVDDHGLLGWCFGPVGVRSQPFEELLRRAPAAFASCAAIEP